MRLKDMQESLDRDLKEPQFAALYLNDALHEGSTEEFLLALRNLIRVSEEMKAIAAQTELERENIYKALSESENPHFSTVYEIVSAIGLQISFQPSAWGHQP